TVRITVTTAVQTCARPIVATNDTYTTPQEITLTTTVAEGVLKNDTDGDNDPLTARMVTTTSNGTLTLNLDGSFTYVPNAGYVGKIGRASCRDRGKVEVNSA